MAEEQPPEYPSIADLLSAMDADAVAKANITTKTNVNPDLGFNTHPDPSFIPSPNPGPGLNPNPNPRPSLNRSPFIPNPNFNLRPPRIPQRRRHRPSPPKEILDDFGDIVLRVGGHAAPAATQEQRDFKVCSHTLRRVGSGWDRVLEQHAYRAAWRRGEAEAEAEGEGQEGGDGDGDGDDGGEEEERDEEGCRVVCLP